MVMDSQKQTQSNTESKVEGCIFTGFAIFWGFWLIMLIVSAFLNLPKLPGFLGDKWEMLTRTSTDRFALVVSVGVFVLTFLYNSSHDWRRALKYAILSVIAIYVGHLWLAPFVDRLQEWIKWG